jgi:hypothetical protein
MSRSIDRINAMVTRAKQHIQDFQLGLQAFYQTNPYEVSVKEDPQAGKRIYYVSKADCVPDSLAAIAADVIQNLRSPLDHLAYQLVLDARGGTEPDWLVYYPICKTAADYPATRSGKIKGVRQAVIDAIDATEPYPTGKGHALWQLNELNKPSKHQLLIGAGSYYRGMDISSFTRRLLKKTAPSIDIKVTPWMLAPADNLMHLSVGNELVIEPLDLEVDKEMRLAFDVSLDKAGVIDCEPALKTLQDFANLVGDIVPRLGRLLP